MGSFSEIGGGRESFTIKVWIGVLQLASMLFSRELTLNFVVVVLPEVSLPDCRFRKSSILK